MYSRDDLYVNTMDFVPIDVDFVRMRLGGGEHGIRPLFPMVEKKEVCFWIGGTLEVG